MSHPWDHYTKLKPGVNMYKLLPTFSRGVCDERRHPPEDEEPGLDVAWDYGCEGQREWREHSNPAWVDRYLQRIAVKKETHRLLMLVRAGSK